MKRLKTITMAVGIVTAAVSMIACSQFPTRSDTETDQDHESTSAEVGENLLRNPDAREGKDGWIFFGDAGVKTEAGGGAAFFTRDNASRPAYIVQNVRLGDNWDGKYLVLAAMAWVEEVREGSITRRPSLHGDQIEQTGHIAEYMQGQRLLFRAGSGEWTRMYGIFQIKPGVVALRIFLGQASMNGDPPDGTLALFRDVEAIVFNIRQEAEEYIAQQN